MRSAPSYHDVKNPPFFVLYHHQTNGLLQALFKTSVSPSPQDHPTPSIEIKKSECTQDISVPNDTHHLFGKRFGPRLFWDEKRKFGLWTNGANSCVWNSYPTATHQKVHPWNISLTINRNMYPNTHDIFMGWIFVSDVHRNDFWVTQNTYATSS